MKVIKNLRGAGFLAASLFFLGILPGCASVVTFRLPEEFKNKKVIEDPPATSSLPGHKPVLLAYVP